MLESAFSKRALWSGARGVVVGFVGGKCALRAVVLAATSWEMRAAKALARVLMKASVSQGMAGWVAVVEFWGSMFDGGEGKVCGVCVRGG